MRISRLFRLAAVMSIGGLATAWVSAQGARQKAIAQIAAVVDSPTAIAGTDVVEHLRITLPPDLHVNSNQPHEASLVPLGVIADVPAGVSVLGTTWPTAVDIRTLAGNERLSVFEGEFTIDMRLRLAADLPPGPLRIPVHVRYQACDATRCYFPVNAATAWEFTVASAAPAAAPTMTTAASSRPAEEPAARVPAALDRFVVSKTAAGYLSSSEFLAFLGASSVTPVDMAFAGGGVLAILGLVFIGGVALNLTPCVLPLIPVNLAILGAGKAAVSRRRGLLLGSAHGGAMAVVYGALGLVVVLTSRAFGAINASPWFNAGIAVVFVLLALSMFEVFFLDLSRYSPRLTLSSARGSMALAVTMGGVAALLAGACVAPVVVQVVVFSSGLYASGVKAALALPFVLGLGMAAPWPLAGAGLAALPRPGAWMVRVKQVFGVAILALAAFYAHSAFRLFVDRGQASAVASPSTSDGWHTSLDQALADAERQHKPVFVDLWATWCKNCLAMDQTTFAEARVKAALAGYVIVKVQAEDPDDPATRGVMQRFGAIGLPTYVVLERAPTASPRAMAERFSLENLGGQTISLDEWRGRVVVLNFWATWCPGCKTEIPELMRLRSAFPETEVVVAGIATDDQGRAAVSPFVARERFDVGGTVQTMNYPVLLGTAPVADAYHVESLPTTFVFDREGRIARRIDVPVRFADLEHDIRALLASSGNGSRPADGGLNTEKQ